MSRHRNGGPAFPAVLIEPGDNYNPPKEVHYGGMSLRDYFAAKAMQGLAVGVNEPDYEVIATMAYKLASAMIAARNV